MGKVFISIPEDLWRDFKSTFMTTWFLGSPTLIRHRELKSDGREFATVIAKYAEDIETLISMIPAGGIAVHMDLDYLI